MAQKIIKAALLFLIVTAVSCSRTPESLTANDYAQWVSSEAKGYVKQKKVNAVNMVARYRPAALLAYHDFSSENNEVNSYDSIYNYYRCGLNFQFSMQADRSDKQYGNLKYYNIASEEELIGRTRYLSFSTSEFFELEWNENKYYPVLSVFEGFDDLENRLIFTLVFQVPEFNCSNPPETFDNVNLTFEDPLWGLGTNHFQFQKPVFENKPKLKL